MIRRFLQRAFAPERRWVVLAVLGAGSFGLGYAGLSESRGAPAATLDRVYSTAQLFLVEYPDGITSTDWMLQVARFVAPVVAASTVIAAFASLFRERISRMRLRFARGHVVVCGLGEKGTRIADGFSEQGRRVVAVERNPDEPNVAAARDRGITVLEGDATDPVTLRAVRADRAAEVIAVCGEEGTNAEVAAVMRSAMSRSGDPMRCAVHLLDATLCSLLRYQTLLETSDGIRLEFFNIYQHGAHLALREHDALDAADGRPPHLLVFGLGQFGQSLVLTAARRWSDDGKTGRDLRCTVVDRHATGRVEAMRLRNPSLDRAADINAIDVDLDLPTPDAAAALRRALGDDSITSVFVCFDDDSFAMATALWARRTLAATTAGVVVRTQSETGLAVLLERDEGGLSTRLHGFGLLDRTCTPELVTGGVHELVARALHDEYLSGLDSARAATAGAYARPWDELPEEARESNRRAADQIGAGLRSIGCDLAPRDAWDGPDLELAPEELDALARVEHERWMDERTSAGWRYGATRDDIQKLNPLLRPWGELSPDARAGGLETARELPALLARAGFEIVRDPAVSPRPPGAD